MPNGYSATSYPNGVNNAGVGTVTSNYLANDPSLMHTYFNDFDYYTAGDWTGTATGSVTNSAAAGDGGWVTLINSAANNDLNSIQLPRANFAIVAGQDAWFKARLKVSNATNANLLIGLIQTTITPFTVTDGVYIRKNAATTTMTGNTTKSSATSSVNIGTMANDTFLNVGFHYTGSSIIFYVNNSVVGSIPQTNLPTAALTLTIAESNGTAAAITTTVDYVLASTLRAASAM